MSLKKKLSVKLAAFAMVMSFSFVTISPSQAGSGMGQMLMGFMMMNMMNQMQQQQVQQSPNPYWNQMPPWMNPWMTPPWMNGGYGQQGGGGYYPPYYGQPGPGIPPPQPVPGPLYMNTAMNGPMGSPTLGAPVPVGNSIGAIGGTSTLMPSVGPVFH